MSKVSMAKAAKMFAVSRPSLAKHIEKGKISAEKVGDTWQIDMSELQRVYPYRDAKDDTAGHDTLSARASPPDNDLHAENKVLQAKLEAAEAIIEEKNARIEDLRRMLPGPDDRQQDRGQRRRWWRFFGDDH